MSQQISSLSLAEGKNLIFEIKTKKKILDLKITTARNEKRILEIKKKKIRDERKKRLEVIQSEIKTAVTKSLKDSKRKNKLHEATVFDNKLKTKKKDIDNVNKKINELQKEKGELLILQNKVQQHIYSLK